MAPREKQQELVQELHGHVRKALESPHANYVIQKAIEVMPPALAGFVVNELSGVAVPTAKDRYGCRAICRLLEHCPHDQTDCLIHEVLREVSTLCRHSYGNYV